MIFVCNFFSCCSHRETGNARLIKLSVRDFFHFTFTVFYFFKHCDISNCWFLLWFSKFLKLIFQCFFYSFQILILCKVPSIFIVYNKFCYTQFSSYNNLKKVHILGFMFGDELRIFDTKEPVFFSIYDLCREALVLPEYPEAHKLRHHCVQERISIQYNSSKNIL